MPFILPVLFSVGVREIVLHTMFPDNNWLNSYLSTFVLLHPQADINAVKNKFTKVFIDEAGGQLKDAKMLPAQVQFGLQPITGIHLNIFEKGFTPVIGTGSLNESGIATYSYLLTGIAIFILVMACVNFRNLSIAGSLKRSKEIGIRKISGGTRNQIVWQFLAEASILCCLSYILAIKLVASVLPVFNHLAQKEISFSLPSDIVFFLFGLILMTICILLVGLYPAIKLSLFNTTGVLYNRQKSGGKNIFSKSLTVLQFTLAVSLLIATIIYYRQMRFIAQNDPGFNQFDIIKIDLPVYRDLNRQTINVFRNKLVSETSIIQVAGGEMVTGEGAPVKLKGGEISARHSYIDPFFLPTLEIALKEGRNFYDDFRSDSGQSVMVNETFVKESGVKNPVGQQITMINRPGINQTRYSSPNGLESDRDGRNHAGVQSRKQPFKLSSIAPFQI